MIPRPSSVQIAVAMTIVILVGLLWLNHERVRRAEDRARAAEVQAQLDAESVRQLDRYTETTTIIREKAQEAERVVRTAPGADAPIDPDNRRILCAELERVRGGPVCTD